VNPNDKKAEEKFKEISEANDVLSARRSARSTTSSGSIRTTSIRRRRRRRRAGATVEDLRRRRGTRRTRCAEVPFDFEGFDFSGFQGGGRAPGSAQEQAGGGFGGSFRDIFGGIFSGGHSRPSRGPRPGTDLEYQVSVDFWSAVRGGVARLEIERQETCPACKGKSTTGGNVDCPECGGTGQVTQMGGRMKFNINARAATARARCRMRARPAAARAW